MRGPNAEVKFALIDTTSRDAFEFQFFPNEIRITDRANWQAQDTTIGTKPLFYANGDPKRISVQELHLDSTEQKKDLRAQLKTLRALKEERDDTGTPPVLLAIWGDNNERVVIEDLTVDEILFNERGNCIRAKIGLELIQIQDAGEATSVTVVESVYSDEVQPG